MKKGIVIPFIVFILFAFVGQGLSAQRYLARGAGAGGDYCVLNLTEEQIKKIDRLELDLYKELSPLFSKLRSVFIELDELETQASPDQKRIEAVWERICQLEDDIRNRELQHEKKISDLLTEEQKTLIESFYSYGRGGLGRGNFGRGYGRYNYGAWIGQNYLGQDSGELARGYYGYGRGIRGGYGRMGVYLGQGAVWRGYGQNPPFLGVRYGRGPCGAGLGRGYLMGVGRGRWIWYR